MWLLTFAIRDITYATRTFSTSSHGLRDHFKSDIEGLLVYEAPCHVTGSTYQDVTPGGNETLTS
jgi:hypothetical protein